MKDQAPSTKNKYKRTCTETPTQRINRVIHEQQQEEQKRNQSSSSSSSSSSTPLCLPLVNNALVNHVEASETPTTANDTILLNNNKFFEIFLEQNKCTQVQMQEFIEENKQTRVQMQEFIEQNKQTQVLMQEFIEQNRQNQVQMQVVMSNMNSIMSNMNSTMSTMKDMMRMIINQNNQIFSGLKQSSD